MNGVSLSVEQGCARSIGFDRGREEGRRNAGKRRDGDKRWVYGSRTLGKQVGKTRGGGSIAASD